MKIKSIQAMQVEGIRFSAVPNPAQPDEPRGVPSWIAGGPIASPIDRFRRYAGNRPAWMPDWPMVTCVVEADDGSWGFAPTDHGPAVAPIIERYLGPRLCGEDVSATEQVYDLAVAMCAPFTASGLASYEISAIDLALWDLKGKLAGRPVYELLGGPSHDALECYATGGDYEWTHELGFGGIKLPCPYGPHDGSTGLRRNVEFLKSARAAVGDDVDLMLDCWMSLDVDYTVRLADRLRPVNVRWLEECLPPTDLHAHAELRRRLPSQTLATGEHWQTPVPFQYAVREGLVDILQPDIQWVGGLTALSRICHLAAADGVSVMPHAGGNTPYGQHASLALPAIGTTEFFLSTAPGAALRSYIDAPGVPIPVNGVIHPSSAPGFGVEIEADRLHPFHG